MTDWVDGVIGQWGRERPDLEGALDPIAVLVRVQRLHRLLERELKSFFAEHDLEPGEFDVLASLRRSGPPYALTAGAFLKVSMVTSGAITNRIDRMEAKGLVERVRDVGDRRTVRIRLTDRGLRLTDRVLPAHLDNYARLLAPLEPAERDRVAAALRTLLEAHGDTAPPLG
ncbi:MarR family transcriptional regulator [Streptomyces sp. NPDC049906]|uniref:MarR family winged helix-turn-helix transcriptional regulator n=1 Tax=Streptomyces sp. NPDC049906 TaxID=3155656 RepID=UPI00343E8DC1